ncbi:hypothetical protein [Nocardia sp. 348MFTsu5.1]|jgi:hypothetical protein|uniref:hypothetical protein n=1 Tax=Nocardia sp. 348MFTsu5.1 TaxID=1172185 RepID=UPI00036186AA|nr:hypothetical protein [Nocardia sp. 348MFTsu5.1]
MTTVIAEGITAGDLKEFWTTVGYLVWFSCVIAIMRIMWLGGLLYEARKSGNTDGVTGIAAQLVALVVVSSSAAIATALLS